MCLQRRARGGRVRHVDDSELAEVAKVYRTAGAQDRSPIDAVREHFFLSRRTAERAIAGARRAGELGAALSRRAGEAVPEGSSAT
jgi:hypothetical protein